MNKVTCQNEIIEIHHFFTDWFNGSIKKNDHTFSRFQSVIAPQFNLITPSGITLTAPQALNTIFTNHGSRANDASPFQITIKDIRLRFSSSDYAMLNYEEWQKTEDKTTARLSTVIFRPKPSTPNGIEWFQVHETWLPENTSS